jgi:hypothetical protein
MWMIVTGDPREGFAAGKMQAYLQVLYSGIVATFARFPTGRF